MHARGLIPAWAKASVGAFALTACTGGDLACQRLQRELYEVKQEGGVRRSILWAEEGTAGDNSVVHIRQEQPGDFPYFHSTQATRECLGSDWSEGKDALPAEGWSVPATRFRSSGWPDIVVYEESSGDMFSADGGRFSRRVLLVIEGAS